MAIRLTKSQVKRIKEIIELLIRRGYNRAAIIDYVFNWFLRDNPDLDRREASETLVKVVDYYLKPGAADERGQESRLKKRLEELEIWVRQQASGQIRTGKKLDIEFLADKAVYEFGLRAEERDIVKRIITREIDSLRKEIEGPLREERYKKRVKDDLDELLFGYGARSIKDLKKDKRKEYIQKRREIIRKHRGEILGETLTPTEEIERRKKRFERYVARMKPWERRGFDKLSPLDQQSQRIEWYQNERKKGREEIYKKLTEYKKGKISKQEYKNDKDRINQELKGKKGEALGEISGVARARHGVLSFKQSDYGSYITKVAWLIAMLAAGTFTFSFSSFFFYGFLALALYVLVPPPQASEDGEKLSGDDFNVFSAKYWRKQRSRTHGSFAWFKSIFKVTAIIMFALAFRSLGDVFNIAFIATVFIGYFSMKVEYDPKYAGEFIESLIRFGVLGAYFIPFWVFGSIFQSYVLVAIAFAFFAIPPMPKAEIKNLGEVLSQGLSGMTAYYRMFDMGLFGLLMIFALMGALLEFPGWALEGPLKTTFIYFWVVSGIAGLFSPLGERPLTGLIMLGGATIIYGIGPGSQEVGTALLGPWWPVVHNGVTDTFEPVVATFDQLGQTFSNAFLLITNPVGYATSILNGTYAKNPTGKTGAFGVEISDFSVSPVYMEQPFIVSVSIKNEGSYPAKGVRVELKTDSDTSPLETREGAGGIPAPFTEPSLPPINPYAQANRKRISITELGFEKTSDWVIRGDRNGVFLQQDSRFFAFESDGVTCPVITKYSLRNKYIPLVAEVTYDYEVGSNLEMEFLDTAEWERRVKEKLLYPQQKLSHITTAPVKLSIGTLDQPILESTPFHIGLNLNSQEGKQSKINSATMEMQFPPEFKLEFEDKDPNIIELPDCTAPDKITWELSDISTNKNGKVVWKFDKPEEIIPVWCSFERLGDITQPSKTFLVTANATYSFSRWKNKDTRIEFRGGCPVGGGIKPTEYLGGIGSENFCSDKIEQTNTKCIYGQGGCKSDSECDQSSYVPEKGELVCKSLDGVTNNVCCYEKDKPEDCKNAFDRWVVLGASIPKPPPPVVPPPVVPPPGALWYVPTEYQPYVIEAAQKYILEPELIAAVIKQESDWNKNAYKYESHLNDASYGLMQLLCNTARVLEFAGVCNELFNPNTNIEFGSKYLAILNGNFGENGVQWEVRCEIKRGSGQFATYNTASFAKGLNYVIAAYNGGQCANVESSQCPGKTWWECEANEGYAVTRDYVYKVKKNYNQFKYNPPSS